MSSVDIKKIMENTGLSQKEIEKMIEEKKKGFKGLVSDDGALILVLKELGIKGNAKETEIIEDREIDIGDITFGMRNVSVIGRIRQINRTYPFKRNDGSDGYVNSFILSDTSGDIKVILWNEQVNILENESFEVNSIIKLKDVYVKKDRNEKKEINLGESSEIIISPEGVNYRKFPKIKEEIIKLKDVELVSHYISIEAKILRKFPKKEFTRKMGEKGEILSVIVIDSTTSIKVNFWDNFVSELDNYQEKDVLLITNLLTRNNEYSKSIELNSSKGTKITKLTKVIKIESSIFKINELKLGISSFKGIVTHIFEKKEVSLKSGDTSENQLFIISDDLGLIKLTLWNTDIKKYEKILEKENSVLVKNGLVKYNNFTNLNEVVLIDDSKVQKTELEISNPVTYDLLPSQLNEDKYKVSDIYSIDESNFFKITGFVVKGFTKINIYEACINCFKKVSKCSCDKKGDTELRVILDFVIDDETSTIKTVFIGDVVEQVLKETAEELRKLEEAGELENYIHIKSKEFLGKDVVIYGKAKYNTFTKKYELYVHKFDFMDFKEEIGRLVKEIES